MRKHWTALVFGLGLLMASGGAVGQAGDSAMPLPDGAMFSGADTSGPRPEYGTPRALIRTFLTRMESVRSGQTDAWPMVIRCFHIDEITDVPEEQREAYVKELATEIDEIFEEFTVDHTRYPESLEGNRYEASFGPSAYALNLQLRKKEERWGFLPGNVEESLAQWREEAAAAKALAEPDAGAEVVYKPGYESPRETMRTFFRSVDKWRETGMTEAIDAFDLSDMPNEDARRQRGQELTVQFSKALNRIEYLVLKQLPHDPAALGGSYRLIDDPAGFVDLAPVGGDEEQPAAWKFTKASIENIPRLYDKYRKRPLADGIESEDLPQLKSLFVRDWVHGNAPFLLEEWFYLENWQWLGLLGLVVAGMGVSRLVAFVLVLVIRRFYKQAHMERDVDLEKGFVLPIRIALMAWVWVLGLSLLVLPAAAFTYLNIIAESITAVAAVWAFYRLIDIAGAILMKRAEATENKLDDLLVPFASRTLKVFTVCVGVVYVAQSMGFNPTTLITGLGIGGLAVALAAKDALSNVFGSLTILLDQPFQIGDWIKVGDVEGNVEYVGMRSTRIRTFYNSLLTVPNSELITSSIDNLGARRYRRIKCHLSLTYDTPPEKIDAFCEGVRELIRRHPYTRKDYFHCYFNVYGAHSLDVLLYCFLATPDWPTELRERHRLFNDILRLAHTLGIEFAFPTQTLYMRRDETPGPGETPPDEAQAQRWGRQEARRILAETLGVNAEPPPPVRFDAAPPPEEDDLEPNQRGGDAGDGEGR